jgi:hypothetical protein
MRFELASALGTLAATAAFVATSMPAAAASSGTLNATVSVASPCIQLDQNSIDFGSLGFSSQNAPTNGTKTAALTNCGGQSEDILARGTDATDGTNALWTLIQGGPNPCDLAGVNKFFLWSDLVGFGNPSGGGLRRDADMLIATGVGAARQATVEATVTMPCNASDGVGATAHFAFIYTASF